MSPEEPGNGAWGQGSKGFGTLASSPLPPESRLVGAHSLVGTCCMPAEASEPDLGKDRRGRLPQELSVL